MRHFLCTCNDADLIQRSDVWTQTTVDAKHPTINDGGKIQVIEDLTATLPNVGVAILALTFVVEAVNLGDLSTFVVSSEQRDTGRMSRLQCHQQGEGLQAKVSTIHEIALIGSRDNAREKVGSSLAMFRHTSRRKRLKGMWLDLP